MAILINEQKLVDDNVFQYENRLNSSISRFLDKSPTFVTYYHVNYQETTMDGGFRDIEEILGNRSPLKFQKIENFPLYGIDPVVLNITDSEQGLDTDYSGEAVVLPNTIKPLQNDFFMINTIKGSFIFRVVAIQYDNIRPDNFYKLEFRFEYLDEEKVDNLNNQVHERFTCLLENIGTENTCLIQEEYMDIVNKVDSMYHDMVQTYKVIFYNERYNCFLGEIEGGKKIYDPLQTVFFNKHKLLNRKNDLKTIVLTEGFVDPKRELKYEKSIYRLFERRDTKLIRPLYYNTFPAMYKKDSQFYRWHDQSIYVADIPVLPNLEGDINLLPLEIANSFKMNGPTESKYIELMQKFIRREEISLYDIPLDLNEELLLLDANEEVFFFTPILLYIIKTTMTNFLSSK